MKYCLCFRCQETLVWMRSLFDKAKFHGTRDHLGFYNGGWFFGRSTCATWPAASSERVRAGNPHFYKCGDGEQWDLLVVCKKTNWEAPLRVQHLMDVKHLALNLAKTLPTMSVTQGWQLDADCSMPAVLAQLEFRIKLEFDHACDLLVSEACEHYSRKMLLAMQPGRATSSASSSTCTKQGNKRRLEDSWRTKLLLHCTLAWARSSTLRQRLELRDLVTSPLPSLSSR